MLDHFLSRGKEAEAKIDTFLVHNSNGFGRTEKQLHLFWYCIGGSGVGKTWFGKHVATRLQQKNKTCIYLDFSNGDRWHSYLSLAKFKNPASVSLGIRIVARQFFGCSAKTLIERLPGTNGPACTDISR